MVKKQHELIWANEVMEVYQNLGTLPGSRNWSSPSARHLFDWVSLEENKTKFLTTMVPKATDIISKYGDRDVTEEVVKIDKKTLTELHTCLATALEEAQEGKRPEPEVAPDPEPILTLEDLL